VITSNFTVLDTPQIITLPVGVHPDIYPQPHFLGSRKSADMKFGHYATAFASLSLYASTLAVPVVQKQIQTPQQKEAERAKELAKAKNKYFHEPGYVTVPFSQIHVKKSGHFGQ
jgi:hypothetical protein